MSAPAADASASRRPLVTAVLARTGSQLPVNPVLHHGDRVILRVPGFARRARVVVALVGLRHLDDNLRAGRRGVIVFAYTVPGWIRPGRYTLVFSGPAPPDRGRFAGADNSRPRRDRAAFVVSVPYDPPWRFRVGVGSHGGAHHGTDGGGHQPVGGGVPATTGFDLFSLIVAACLAIVAGALALGAARKSGRNLT